MNKDNLNLTDNQIKLYKKYKNLHTQLKEFVKTDLFKEFEGYILKHLQKANSLKDIDIKVSEEKLKTEIIYKKAKVEVYTSIVKFLNMIKNLGELSNKELKKIEKED